MKITPYDSPCKGCRSRIVEPNCHTDCPAYLAFRAKIDKISLKRYAETALNAYLITQLNRSKKGCPPQLETLQKPNELKMPPPAARPESGVGQAPIPILLLKKVEKSMDKYEMKVRITFFEEVLGTASANPDIHREYIASKAPDAESIEEEVAAIGVDAALEKSMTVFPRDADGNPIFFDYQIKGFFKDSAGALRKVPGSKCSKVKAYKKEIDGLLFVSPRMIPMNLSEDIGTCTRPLRAQTAQGERVALATSETVPAGTSIDLTITALTKDMFELAKECLDYGTLRGIGQWRNSGKGRFTYEVTG